MRRVLRLLKWLLAAAVLLALAYQLWIFGHLLWWTKFNPDETRFMSLRLSELRERQPDAQLRRQWVPYERISVHLKRAVIAAEDDGFVDHEGFDWEGIQKAMEKNRKKGRAVAGGSTISQQLAKNLFLSPSRSYLRKAQEAAITFMMEAVMDKRRILEIYLNVVEWGDGVFGAEAAAQHYFNKPAAQLNAWEGARLAVMLPAPKRFEQSPRSAYLNGRTRTIVARARAAELP